MKKLVMALALFATCLCANGFAQTYPSRQLTLIVPFPPGGSTDVAARIMAERMRPRTLDEYVGQRHLVGPGRPLRQALERRHRINPCQVLSMGLIAPLHANVYGALKHLRSLVFLTLG